MTREPNPYAKAPALTTNAVMAMSVPSIVAEDVLNGPDVVDAQHQKNTDIHVSSADREKWNKVADTHTADIVYTCEEDENTIDASIFMCCLVISYTADPSMTHYTEVTLHFSKSAEPDIHGAPWESDEPVYMCLANAQTGDICISDNAILPTPGSVGTFKFTTPAADMSYGLFCTDPSNMEETIKPIGLRVNLENTTSFNGIVVGSWTRNDGVPASIICTVRNEYAHAKDSDIHITASVKQTLSDISEKVGTGNGLAMGENSQTSSYAATAYGDKSSVLRGIGIGYGANVIDGIAIGINAEADDYGIAIGGIFTSNVAPTKAIGQDSIAIGHSAQATARGAIVIGDSTTLADENVICIGGRNTTNGSTNEAHLCVDTRLYLLKAKSPLAEQYEGGAAALGYIVRDDNGNVLECGTRKLSELLTNNTAFAPATLDLDSNPPTPFLPTGITEPWEEPERVEVPEETQEEANTPFEKLKAKLAEFVKTRLHQPETT